MINRLKSYFVYSILVGCLLVSCGNNGDEAIVSGDGKLMMRAIMTTDEASSGDDTLADSCNIYLYNDYGIIRKYKGIESLPDELWLKSGVYRAEAWSGDSVPASFDAKYYKGTQSFSIITGETTMVELTCGIANAVVSVNYDTEVTDALNDYSIIVSNSRGSLKFEGDDTRKGYFMMPSGVTQLDWTLNATTFDGKPFSKKGVISNVKGGTEYCINIKYTGNLPEQGGAMVEIVVDETEINVNHNVPIASAPMISGVDFDLTQTLECDSGAVGRRAVVIASPIELYQVIMSCDSLVDLGFDALNYELLPITEDMSDYLLHKGINYLYRTYSDGSSNFVLNFSAKLCDALPRGDYPIVIEAIDKDGLKRVATFKLKIK